MLYNRKEIIEYIKKDTFSAIWSVGLTIYIVVSLYNSIFNDDSCERTIREKLNQKGFTIVLKKWRNTAGRVWVAEGKDSINHKSKIEFDSSNMFDSISFGDTIVKNKLDSIYYLHKKKWIIKYLNTCYSYKIDSISR